MPAPPHPRLRDGGSKAVTGLGWDNYATDHEDANGQFEQSFSFADALTTCDRADHAVGARALPAVVLSAPARLRGPARPAT
ncbi:MAG TPA: hypothetical protein VKG82_03935 [Solirubrobacteraceae bacterium]|nr:hypothetical protein [Solirubrobacteraceae bacterium]